MEILASLGKLIFCCHSGRENDYAQQYVRNGRKGYAQGDHLGSLYIFFSYGYKSNLMVIGTIREENVEQTRCSRKRKEKQANQQDEL